MRPQARINQPVAQPLACHSGGLTKPKPAFATQLACVAMALLAAASTLRAQSGATLTTLHTFTGTDGGKAVAGLVLGSDGNLYGTTSGVAADNDGTVFRVTTAGVFTNLHIFTANASDTTGSAPIGGLVQSSGGSLYGTTSGGGVDSSGTVFRITTTGALTTLYTFTDLGDGSDPVASLSLSGSSFYGTTAGGTTGYGTVFETTNTGSLGTIYAFTGGTDGGNPTGSPVLGGDGNLYGTTSNDGDYGYGTIYRITTSGSFSVIYSFTGGTDGANPVAGLLKPGDGYFYGVTEYGGAGAAGTVFRITTTGTLTTLHAFTGGTDGANPVANLILGSDGYLYGTTTAGGSAALGAIFRVSTTGGAFTSLYSFTGGADGSAPNGSLVEGANDTFYGTTNTGGADGFGTVFALSVYPAFFDGATALGNGVYYLAFADGTPFGYYSYLTEPHYIYHFDLGYEYVFDANDGKDGVYFYDFASSDFFYTSPTFPFPYLYDFGASTVLYYFPNTSSNGHYTTNPRYFYDFATGQIITK